jgi:hypothetical protein
VGQNLLLFQQLENALKFLVARGEISGYASQIRSLQKKRSETVAKQTLGAVSGQFFEQNFSTDVDNEQLPDQLKEPHLKVGFQFDVENENPESRKEALSSLVASRNYLVHHFLERIAPDTLESWLDTSEYLDGQREEIIPELDYYSTHASSVKDMGEEMAEFLSSEEGRKYFLSLRDGV